MEVLYNKSGIKYTIDEENKIVIAEVFDARDDFARILFNKFGIEPSVSEGLMSNIATKYRGIAKCSSVDVFDKSVGMDIARNKALIKRETAYIKALNKFSKQIESIQKDVLDTVFSKAKIISKRLSYLGEHN